MSQPVVGVIGTGRIGNPMAANLLKAGYRVVVCDVRAEAVANLVDLGAENAESPGSLAREAEVILLSLTTVELVEAVLFGPEGICTEPVSGKTIIDTSTILPSKAQEFAQRIAAQGGALLDAPVTGGEGGAQAGTLSIMVGGDEGAFESVGEILRVVGGTITYIGASGAGQVAKMVNQMIMAGYFVAIAEGFSFAEKLGIDVGKCFAAIEHGGARSGLLSGFGQAYIRIKEQGAAPPPAYDHYAELFIKDLHYALEEGYKHRVYMPGTSTAHEIAKQMLSRAPHAPFPLRFLDVWDVSH